MGFFKAFTHDGGVIDPFRLLPDCRLILGSTAVILSMTLTLTLTLTLPAQTHLFSDGSAQGECRLPSLEPTPVPASLMHSLLDWIAAHTDYDVAEIRTRPPLIRVCESCDVVPTTPIPRLEESLAGASDAIHRCDILAVQLTNGIHDCLQQVEWDAQRLQNAYLAKLGIASGFEWMRLLARSKCPRDIHP